MSKGLEALKELKDRAVHDEYLFRQDTDREKAISFLNEIDNLVDVVEKELNVLKIIKEKKVDTFSLRKLTLDEYNYGVKLGKKNTTIYECELLTQEEYDSIREILL